MNVGIVITTYNEPEEFVLQAVASALTQTHESQVILVADGVEPPEVNHENCHTMRVTHRGQWGARNAGAMALLPYADAIAFLDADDWLEANWVEACIRAAAYGDMVTTAQRMHYADGTVEDVAFGPPATTPRFNQRNPTFAQLWEHNSAPSNAFFMAHVFEETGGFNTSLGYAGDLAMWLDALDRGYHFGHAEDTFFNYRVQRTDGLTYSIDADRRNADRRNIYESLRPAFERRGLTEEGIIGHA